MIAEMANLRRIWLNYRRLANYRINLVDHGFKSFLKSVINFVPTMVLDFLLKVKPSWARVPSAGRVEEKKINRK